jgi:hypothetical protein
VRAAVYVIARQRPAFDGSQRYGVTSALQNESFHAAHGIIIKCLK